MSISEGAHSKTKMGFSSCMGQENESYRPEGESIEYAAEPPPPSPKLPLIRKSDNVGSSGTTLAAF